MAKKNVNTIPATIPLAHDGTPERITSRTFTNGTETWEYNPDLITMEQAVLADEAMQFKMELLQRDAESFNQVVEAGGVEWFAKCAGALLVRVEGGTAVPHSPAQWLAASRFVNKLPYKHMGELRECVEDFFGSIGRASTASYVFNAASKRKSNGIVSALLTQALKKHDNALSSLTEPQGKQA